MTFLSSRYQGYCNRDLAGVLAVARNEKQPSDAGEIIKGPMVLEFLGLKLESQ